jgi:hypothetical protein
MTPQQIIALLRDQTGTTTTMVSDLIMYDYINIAYKKLWAKIIDIDKNY